MRAMHDDLGTLDFIIYFVLTTVGVEPVRFAEVGVDRSMDSIALENARRFVRHFAGRPISAIRAIRDASGMSLVGCKQAWEQILDSYELDTEYLKASVERSLDQGDYDSARHFIRRMEE